MILSNYKQLHKHVLFSGVLLICATMVVAQQRVGIGTYAPATKLNVVGYGANPTLPGFTSTGIFRIGISDTEGIDMGKMGNSPYAGWIQVGYEGFLADPLSLQPLGGNVGIGTGNASPAYSAVLELKSDSKGFLPPRLTFLQRNSIVNPEVGLVLYCKDCSYNGQLQVYNGSYWESMMGTPGDGLPVVGDVAGTGVIFYIFQPGDPGYIAGETHGLIAGSTYDDIEWGCFGVDVPGANGTALGTGQQNTIDIENECSFPNAAEVCTAINSYLPSKDELILLKNSGYMDLTSHCAPPLYHCQWWSSSEINANTVWVLDVITNTMIAGAKNNYNGNVIPITKF